VRFDINVDAAKRSHLTISSQLLNLARIVRTS
jgi:YfiR/HmsC-like